MSKLYSVLLLITLLLLSSACLAQMGSPGGGLPGSGGPGGGLPGSGGPPPPPAPPSLTPIAVLVFPSGGGTVTTEKPITYINGLPYGQMFIISNHSLYIDGVPGQFVWIDYTLSNGVDGADYTVATNGVLKSLDKNGHYEITNILLDSSTGPYTHFLQLYKNYTAYAKTILTDHTTQSNWAQDTDTSTFSFTH